MPLSDLREHHPRPALHSLRAKPVPRGAGEAQDHNDRRPNSDLAHRCGRHFLSKTGTVQPVHQVRPAARCKPPPAAVELQQPESGLQADRDPVAVQDYRGRLESRPTEGAEQQTRAEVQPAPSAYAKQR